MMTKKKHTTPNHESPQKGRHEMAGHPPASPLHGEILQDDDQVLTDGDVQTHVIERPDGFYWQDKPTGKLYGPFPTLLEAREDMQYQEDSDYEEGASLQEAEAEIGITDWIDPETGEPSPGLTPHLSDE